MNCMLSLAYRKKKIKRQRAKQSGFALLEVMIAIALAAVALPALVLTVHQVMSDTAEVKIDSMAQWEAMNQLEVFRLNAQLTEKLPSGDQPLLDIFQTTNEQIPWQGRILVEPSPMEGIQRVTVEVGLERDEPRASIVAFINEPKQNNQRGGGRN